MNRIFSGIRTSGQLHLGNYLGAIRNWIKLQDAQDNEQVIFGLMDYHAITTPYDKDALKGQVLSAAADFLAAGLNPDKSLLIRQSRVPQHTELAWLFNTITPVSWLDRLPTYKEKLEQTVGKYNHMGVLDYPVLMAADILIYKSNLVPVGDDQKQHIDLTNEIASKFNSMFGNTFESVRVPKFEGSRIMSLQNAGKKMSKTGDDGILMSDDPDTIRRKIKSAVTDSGSEIVYDPATKPALSNLLLIFHLLTNEEMESIVKHYEGKGYAKFKEDLSEAMVSYLRPFGDKRRQILSDESYITDVLTKSENTARTIALKNLDEIKNKMGF